MAALRSEKLGYWGPDLRRDEVNSENIVRKEAILTPLRSLHPSSRCDSSSHICFAVCLEALARACAVLFRCSTS
jgi:hypothetical protein